MLYFPAFYGILSKGAFNTLPEAARRRHLRGCACFCKRNRLYAHGLSGVLAEYKTRKGNTLRRPRAVEGSRQLLIRVVANLATPESAP